VGPALLAALAGRPADTSLRELRALARPLAWLDLADEEVLDDLDHPEDLERLRRRLERA
jgi:CTP:molybdopterin cytidylyltransferase MocA